MRLPLLLTGLGMILLLLSPVYSQTSGSLRSLPNYKLRRSLEPGQQHATPPKPDEDALSEAGVHLPPPREVNMLLGPPRKNRIAGQRESTPRRSVGEWYLFIVRSRQAEVINDDDEGKDPEG